MSRFCFSFVAQEEFSQDQCFLLIGRTCVMRLIKLAKYQQNLGKGNIFSSMVGDLYAKFLLKVDDFAYGEGVTVAILQSAPGTVYGLRTCPTCWCWCHAVATWWGGSGLEDAWFFHGCQHHSWDDAECLHLDSIATCPFSLLSAI